MMAILKMSCLSLTMFGTKDGGTHEAGMKTAMTKAYNEYARKVGLLEEERQEP